MPTGSSSVLKGDGTDPPTGDRLSISWARLSCCAAVCNGLQFTILYTIPPVLIINKSTCLYADVIMQCTFIHALIYWRRRVIIASGYIHSIGVAHFFGILLIETFIEWRYLTVGRSSKTLVCSSWLGKQQLRLGKALLFYYYFIIMSHWIEIDDDDDEQRLMSKRSHDWYSWTFKFHVSTGEKKWNECHSNKQMWTPEIVVSVTFRSTTLAL
jgi:hypothetical protein